MFLNRKISVGAFANERRSVMQKLVILLLGFIILFGCAPPDEEPIPVDVIPLFGFNDVPAKSMMKSIVPSGTGRAKAIFFLMSPLLTGFDMNNLNGYIQGDKYNFSVFDTQLEIDISKDGNNFVYSGTLADGSGELSVIYDPSAKTFSYEQILIIQDPNDELNNGTTALEFALYTKLENVSLDNSGYFHTLFTCGIFGYNGDASANFFQGGEWEMYRGEMETGQAGIGFCFDRGINQGGLPDVSGFDETTIEGAVSNAKLSNYKTYLSQVDYSAQVAATGMVNYKLDSETSVNLTENLADNAAMVSALPSIWASNVILQP